MFGNDFDTTLRLMDQLRRRMDRAFDEVERQGPSHRSASYPPSNLYDTGTAFVIEAELPGLTDKDVEITLTQDVLRLSGQRKVDAPEGYSVHRQERAPFRFSRSYALPAKVDPERVGAALRDGVLVITLEKAVEVKPRRIQVKAS
jgi:HSP20 family protein